MKGGKGRLRRLPRVLIALVLISAVDPFLAYPAKAYDAEVSGDCGEAEFDAALDFVQFYGGGTITFDCEPDPWTITFTGQKTITSQVVIDSGGLISLSGGATTRLFYINSGASLTLQNITIRDGYSSGADGGAIWNSGSLTVENSKFLYNSADVAKSGGAIVSYGPLTIIDSEFADNQAYNGGAIYPRWGAAVTNISASTFLRNQAVGAQGSGGALMAWDGPPVTVSDSIFEENSAVYDGGGLYITTNSSLDMQDSHLTDNSSSNMGGALYVAGTANITQTIVISNTSHSGGGIYNSGSITLNSSRMDSNFSLFDGGGIFNSSGVLKLVGSSMNANLTRERGGAIYANGDTTLLNSTFIGNMSISHDAYGGAIYAAGNVNVNFSTFLDNLVSRINIDGKTLYIASAASLSLKNSIIQSGSSACYGNITSQGYNLASDSSCSLTGPFDQPSTPDPGLGQWQDTDGAIWYTMPLPGGPAYNHGECGIVTVDQRGSARPQYVTCDIGAIERSPGDPVYIYLPLLRK